MTEAKDITADEQTGDDVVKTLDAKYLKGLKFRGSKTKITVDKAAGTRKKNFIPYERSMRPDDVLSFKECGDTIVIVTADGQKVTVDK